MAKCLLISTFSLIKMNAVDQVSDLPHLMVQKSMYDQSFSAVPSPQKHVAFLNTSSSFAH